MKILAAIVFFTSALVLSGCAKDETPAPGPAANKSGAPVTAGTTGSAGGPAKPTVQTSPPPQRNPASNPEAIMGSKSK